jgi:hypothetical protein
MAVKEAMTMATYWVSFADDVECVGVAIVDDDDASDAMTIVQKTIELGCNPGPDSEVQIQKIPNDAVPIPERYKNRLLTKGEVDALNAGKAFN